MIDLYTTERQRLLSNSQPLRVNWLAVTSSISTLLVVLVVWRVIYLAVTGWN